MVCAGTFATLLGCLALGGVSGTQQDDVTLIQQAAVPSVDVDIYIDDANSSEGSGASLLGQGVAVFSGISQAMRYELAVRQTFIDGGVTVVEDGPEKPSAGKCTTSERWQMNATMTNLTFMMLNDGKLESMPKECPKEVVNVAGLAVSGAGFAPCMTKLLDVSQPCSQCMLDLIESARGCISKCVAMLTRCGQAAAWFSEKVMKSSSCNERSNACLWCNNGHLKKFTECSGAFAENRERYNRFLDGITGLMKAGGDPDDQKIDNFVVEFGAKKAD